jgi:hypothetical protein
MGPPHAPHGYSGFPMNSFAQQPSMYPPPFYQQPQPHYQQTFIHNSMMFVNQKISKSPPQKISSKLSNKRSTHLP